MLNDAHILKLVLFASFLIVPSVVCLWLICLMAHSLFEIELVNPLRLLIASLIPLIFAAWGTKRKSLSTSGAISGYFVGFIITLSNYAFLACLMAFFVSSSKATKYKSHKKRKLEEDFKEGGQRNWAQVLSNGIVASILAALYILDCGYSELTVDFSRNYRCSWLSLALVGAFSCANGDTWASELGTVLSSKDPFLITTFCRVPKGTNGGVSGIGLVVSFLGGVLIGASFYGGLILFAEAPSLRNSPPQWPLVLVGGMGGLLGSIVDSLLGATLQYSGVTESGCIVEMPGDGVKYIAGIPFLGNHAVNLLSTLITAFILPYFALLCM